MQLLYALSQNYAQDLGAARASYMRGAMRAGCVWGRGKDYIWEIARWYGVIKMLCIKWLVTFCKYKRKYVHVYFIIWQSWMKFPYITIWWTSVVHQMGPDCKYWSSIKFATKAQRL